VQNTYDFSKFMVCRTDKGGEGVIFRDLVRTSFMDGSLVFGLFHNDYITSFKSTKIHI